MKERRQTRRGKRRLILEATPPNRRQAAIGRLSTRRGLVGKGPPWIVMAGTSPAITGLVVWRTGVAALAVAPGYRPLAPCAFLCVAFFLPPRLVAAALALPRRARLIGGANALRVSAPTP